MRSQHHHLSLGLVGVSTQALDIDIIVIIVIIITHSSCDIRLRPGVRDQTTQTITTFSTTFYDHEVHTDGMQMRWLKRRSRANSFNASKPNAYPDLDDQASIQLNKNSFAFYTGVLYFGFISWISDLQT